jgi:hypothetical protein
MPRDFFQTDGESNFGYLRRYEKSSKLLALVAFYFVGFEHVGSGFKCHIELALSKGRINSRLQRWKPLRPGAQQPVVNNSGCIAR